jgi:hypothetical protein
MGSDPGSEMSSEPELNSHCRKYIMIQYDNLANIRILLFWFGRFVFSRKVIA